MNFIVQLLYQVLEKGQAPFGAFFTGVLEIQTG